MSRVFVAALVACLLVLAPAAARAERPTVTVGSKGFAESWILGDALTALARPFAEVDHKKNLGGTQIVFEALRTGAVDVYAEYTGTIAEVILGTTERLTVSAMRERLGALGVGITESLGFNNGYAMAVTAQAATRYGLHAISDLRSHPDLRYGFTHEFLGRADGWPGLSQRYGLSAHDVKGIQHELGYEALASGQIDAMDIYTTDAQIERLHLVLLDDDLGFFRRYDAVLLYRNDLPTRVPEAFAAMGKLVGAVDAPAMMRANASVLLDKERSDHAAAALLEQTLGMHAQAPARAAWFGEIGWNTLRHLELVGVSLIASILFGLPLGILATRSRALATAALSTAGVLQTIPSLALLAFLIPAFGIGLVPALVALFLYGLLPIVQGTHTGLMSIPPALAEAAEALGLGWRARLFHVGLPMASPSILAGIKTSAVICVGTATIAALIGADGLGKPILEGIALRDTTRILEGALPAAVLALIVQWGFGRLERLLVPRGLRLHAET